MQRPDLGNVAGVRREQKHRLINPVRQRRSARRLIVPVERGRHRVDVGKLVVLGLVRDPDHESVHRTRPGRTYAGDGIRALDRRDGPGNVGGWYLQYALVFLALPRQLIEDFRVPVLNPPVEQLEVGSWRQLRESYSQCAVGHGSVYPFFLKIPGSTRSEE